MNVLLCLRRSIIPPPDETQRTHKNKWQKRKVDNTTVKASCAFVIHSGRGLGTYGTPLSN